MQTSDGPAGEAPPSSLSEGARPATEHAVAEEHIHLPPPSIWPMTTAAGVAMAGLGLVTFWPFTAAGLLISFTGIVYWIQELRHELH